MMLNVKLYFHDCLLHQFIKHFYKIIPLFYHKMVYHSLIRLITLTLKLTCLILLYNLDPTLDTSQVHDNIVL